MKARIRIGLIVGAISLVVTTVISALMGICGPGVSLIAGAIAGYIASKKESPATKSDGGKIGAIAGVITGGMGLIGQIIGGILALTLLPPLMESLGNNSYSQISSNDPIIYWLSGMGTSLCFSVGGIILSTLSGAGTGYISTTEKPPETSI
jgi:MFS family permease